MTATTRRAVPLIGALTAAALVLAGCGSTGAAPEQAAATTAASASSAAGSATNSASAGTGASSPGQGGTTVTVTITAAGGCAVQPSTVPAGAVTFAISNVDATAVAEVHLMQGERIRGERENLAPGFENTFSATLDGGSYEIYCPGAEPENQPFTVTGTADRADGSLAALLKQATVDYAQYVSAQAGFLVEGVDTLATAIEKGDLAAAQQAYAKARPFYERIEPVAESFGDLDPEIDARAGDVPDAEWKGFHPIEQALFAKRSVAAAKPFVAGLVAKVAELQKLTGQLQAKTEAGTAGGYQPDEVANGAASLLEEVQKSKITGEEERYSRIDLVDFAANVEGSEQAFAALQPALDEIDPAIAAPIAERFRALDALLAQHEDAKALGGYTRYTDLSKAEIRSLATGLLAVQEPLSQLSAKVAAAG